MVADGEPEDDGRGDEVAVTPVRPGRCSSVVRPQCHRVGWRRRGDVVVDPASLAGLIASSAPTPPGACASGAPGRFGRPFRVRRWGFRAGASGARSAYGAPGARSPRMACRPLRPPGRRRASSAPAPRWRRRRGPTRPPGPVAAPAPGRPCDQQPQQDRDQRQVERVRLSVRDPVRSLPAAQPMTAGRPSGSSRARAMSASCGARSSNTWRYMPACPAWGVGSSASSGRLVYRTRPDPANTFGACSSLVGPAKVDDLAHPEGDEVGLACAESAVSSSERSSVRHRVRRPPAAG